MLNSVFLTPELNANLNFSRTQDLLSDVLVELIRRDFGQPEGTAELGLLDQRKIELRLNRVIRAVLRQANPGSEISTRAKIDWLLCTPADKKPFFYGDVYIDVDNRAFNRRVQRLLPSTPGIGYYQ